MSKARQDPNRSGAAMLTSLVMLSVAGMTVGIILTGTTSYARISAAANHREKSAFLADSGLVVALEDLNSGGVGRITFLQSRDYFSDQSCFDGYDWGFSTHVETIDGTNYLISVGKYDLSEQVVEQSVMEGAGERSIHALFSHACFVGNSDNDPGYTLKIGGVGLGADFIRGDVYCGGNLEVSGDADLRLPELLHETSCDGLYDPETETYDHAFAVNVFTNPLSQAEFDAHLVSVATYAGKFYNNGRYDFGEAFVDTIGNGVYDEGEPFTDLNGNGVRDAGDGYIDEDGNGLYEEGIDRIIDNGNGRYDVGEEWTEDPCRRKRQNGRYDRAGGFWKCKNGRWSWKTSYKYRRKTRSCANWPAEEFEDIGNDSFDPGEPYIDQNGVYDVGEQYLDDRNTTYDYGTQANGVVVGMPDPGPGQRASLGGDSLIEPPDLDNMFYELNKNEASKPLFALQRWGNDVAVTADDFGIEKVIAEASAPEHIFVRNPPTSGSVYSRGIRVYGRSYNKVYDEAGNAIDDYFFEDPSDVTYNTYKTADSIDGTVYTSPMYVNVASNANHCVYYVEGNVYIHHPRVYSLRFRQPGTVITVVAKGNITISDEFYYNADYAEGLTRPEMDSTVVRDAVDALCFIALKNECCTNSGNIYIGDAQFGTGGSIHAMLYAENNFIDNNLDTSGQPFISIYGNMSAGNQLQIHRGGVRRTRLDVTLDTRLKDGTIVVPGLPHPVDNQRSIRIDSAWNRVPGGWKSWSMLD